MRKRHHEQTLEELVRKRLGLRKFRALSPSEKNALRDMSKVQEKALHSTKRKQDKELVLV